MDKFNSRYTFEMLSLAYNNLWYHREVAMMTIPDNNPNTDDVEIYFHTKKEIANLLIIDLFKIIPQVDVIAQGDDGDNFDIVYFNIYEDGVDIGYFGNKVNTNFDVKLCRKENKWYIKEMGMHKFNPLKSINH